MLIFGKIRGLFWVLGLAVLASQGGPVSQAQSTANRDDLQVGFAAQFLESMQVRAPLPLKWTGGGMFGWEPYSELRLGMAWGGLGAFCDFYFTTDPKQPMHVLEPTDMILPSLERSDADRLRLDIYRSVSGQKIWIANLSIGCFPHQGRRFAQKPAKIEDLIRVISKDFRLNWKSVEML
jgi:hypothetical protein